jgi:uncharacterized protein
VTPTQERLTAAMKVAMRARDTVALGALRSVLGVIHNAEAVPAVAIDTDGDSPIAGAASGVGSAERSRRELTDEQVVEIVRAEIADRRTSAAEYRQLGQTEAAVALDAEAEVLESHLS